MRPTAAPRVENLLGTAPVGDEAPGAVWAVIAVVAAADEHTLVGRKLTERHVVVRRADAILGRGGGRGGWRWRRSRRLGRWRWRQVGRRQRRRVVAIKPATAECLLLLGARARDDVAPRATGAIVAILAAIDPGGLSVRTGEQRAAIRLIIVLANARWQRRWWWHWWRRRGLKRTSGCARCVQGQGGHD